MSKNKKLRMVLDTDTFNEIDDQFALIYALLSKEKLNVEAVYAAPFFNENSSGPEDGMLKSYDEILRILDMMKISSDGFAFKGSTDYLTSESLPQENDAVDDLIKKAMKPSDSPLHVLGIGASTNIASAIIAEPEIVDKIVIVWLGGHAYHWPIDNNEFNLKQDPAAAGTLFNCGAKMIHIPCLGVTNILRTTIPEMKCNVKGKGELGNYLFEIFTNYMKKFPDKKAASKVLWDIAAVAQLINPEWVPTKTVNSPVLAENNVWKFDEARHKIQTAYTINRDAVYRDLFYKIQDYSK